MIKLKNELELLLKYLNQSTDSIFANESISEINMFINETIKKIADGEEIEIGKIKLLIAPTGALQDISIDNGWGEEFILMADKIEKIIG